MGLIKTRSDSSLKRTTLSEAAKALGEKGGKSTSVPKSAASRHNGALGGRPTKG